jgi:hypothetical protein
MKDIGTELDAKADGAEGRRAFEYPYRLAMARERECSRQSTQPAANDCDGNVGVWLDRAPADLTGRLHAAGPEWDPRTLRPNVRKGCAP